MDSADQPLSVIPAKAGTHKHCSSRTLRSLWAPACAGARPPHGERGFTLLEMLVALLVFSLAALALLRLEGATIRSTADLDTQTIAQMVARNVAVETITDPIAPALGTTYGSVENGGRNWRWERQTALTADQRIVRVDIAVIDAAGQGAAKLTVVRSRE